MSDEQKSDAKKSEAKSKATDTKSKQTNTKNTKKDTKKDTKKNATKGGKGGDSSSSGTGSVAMIGNLALLFTMTVEPALLQEYKIEDLEKVEKLSDLPFLKEKPEVWDTVVCTSDNESSKTLAQMNKTLKKKLNIDLIVLDKIQTDDDQAQFKDKIFEIAERNNIKIHETEVCDCNVGVTLLIKCGDKEKTFEMTQSKGMESPKDSDEYKEKQKKEEERKKKEKEKRDKERAKKKEQKKPKRKHKKKKKKKAKKEGEEEGNDHEYKEEEEMENDPNKNGENNEDDNQEVYVEDEEKEDDKFKKGMKEENDKPAEGQKPPNDGEDQKTEGQNNEEQQNNEQQQNNEEKKEGEEEEERENPFSKMTDVDFNSFDFFYVDLAEFSNSEYSSSITVDDLIDFMQIQKHNGCSCQFIMNVGEGLDDIDKNCALLTALDVIVFSKFDDGYNILNKIYKKKQDPNYDGKDEEEEKKEGEEGEEGEERREGEEGEEGEEREKKEGEEGEEANKEENDKPNEGQKPPEEGEEGEKKEGEEGEEGEKKEGEEGEEGEKKEGEEGEEGEKKEGEEGEEKKKKKKGKGKKKKDKKKKDKTQNLDRKKMFEFFQSEVLNNSPLKFKDKVAIYPDKFRKLYLVRFSQGADAPEVTEYDMKMYPKPNVHNMEMLDEYLYLIEDNEDKYNFIFNAAMLGKILEQGKEGTSDTGLFVSYLTGMEATKKILECDKNGLEPPEDSNFYVVNLPKKSVEETMSKMASKKAESRFVLDCSNSTKSRYREYNPLLDKNLNPYFSTSTNRKALKNGGFINKDGNLLYDPVYRDTLGSQPKRKKGEPVDPKDLMSSINDIKVSQDMNALGKDPQEEAKKKSAVLPIKLKSYKFKFPEYSLYKSAMGTKKEKDKDKKGKTKKEETKNNEETTKETPEKKEGEEGNEEKKENAEEVPVEEDKN